VDKVSFILVRVVLARFVKCVFCRDQILIL
jgi:hypothetical protein